METHFIKKLQVIRATIGELHKSRTNDYYKSSYLDINDLIFAINPVLDDIGILLIQPIEYINGENILKTFLIDAEDGVKIESSIVLPKDDNPQKTGSIITYYRRYCLLSLLSLPVSEGEDDDGNRGSVKMPQKPNKSTQKQVQWLTEEQYQKTLKCNPNQIKAVLRAFDGSNGKAMKKEYREELIKLYNTLNEEK